MGDERRINQLTAKAYSDIGSSDYFAVDNASEAESKKLPASAIKDGINDASTTANTASTNATRALNIARSTSSFPTGDAYSSSSAYKVGDMVIYNNTLYRCKTACSAASWSVNANNFESISLASAITDLNNDLNNFDKGNVRTTRQWNFEATQTTMYFPLSKWSSLPNNAIVIGAILNQRTSAGTNGFAIYNVVDSNGFALQCTVGKAYGLRLLYIIEEL